jgi:hypothetical protein
MNSGNTRSTAGAFGDIVPSDRVSLSNRSKKTMVAGTRSKSAPVRPTTRVSATILERTADRSPFGRLIRVALALLLLPALLAVLVTGGLGMLVLAVARLWDRLVGRLAKERGVVGRRG